MSSLLAWAGTVPHNIGRMTTAPETLPPGSAVALPRLPAPWTVSGYAALADGTLAVLGTDVNVSAPRGRRFDGTAPATNPFTLARRATGKLWTFDGVKLIDGPTFSLASPTLLFDRFPDGRWLVARRIADVDSGERILSPEGSVLGSVYFGDGIGHMKIDDAGHIWIGWIDEGIFGNRGWRIGDDDRPPSGAGLACFGENGGLVRKADFAEPAIADCYALNIIGSTAWACTYTGFPIISLGIDHARFWSTTLAGTTAIAVAENRVLAAGGYGDEGNQLILLELGETEAIVRSAWRLPFDPGRRRSADQFFIDGRGPTLHLVVDGMWYRWSVSSSPAV
jgi:hypothetical protein